MTLSKKLTVRMLREELQLLQEPGSFMLFSGCCNSFLTLSDCFWVTTEAGETSRRGISREAISTETNENKVP